MVNIELHIKQIEQDGYTVIPSVYDMTTIKKLLALCNEWYDKTADTISENVPFLNRNQPCLYNIQNKDIFFLDALFMSPELEELLKYFLNDTWYKQIPQSEPNYVLRTYSARSSNAGLPLHIDSFIPYIGNHLYAMQMAIILEDQSAVNGCTTVVPGTHQSGKYADKEGLKDAIPVISKAGDVVLWDSRLWHGTTDNVSGKTRWSVLATFARWWLKQQFNMTDNLPQHIYEQLSDKHKAILGFCSVPHNNESEGIDIKSGYESLKSDVSQYRN